MNKKKVLTFLLDMDCVDEDTNNIFKGIHHSIRRFFSSTDATTDGHIPKLRGQRMDSGGGGILFALAR